MAGSINAPTDENSWFVNHEGVKASTKLGKSLSSETGRPPKKCKLFGQTWLTIRDADEQATQIWAQATWEKWLNRKENTRRI